MSFEEILKHSNSILYKGKQSYSSIVYHRFIEKISSRYQICFGKTSTPKINVFLSSNNFDCLTSFFLISQMKIWGIIIHPRDMDKFINTINRDRIGYVFCYKSLQIKGFDIVKIEPTSEKSVRLDLPKSDATFFFLTSGTTGKPKLLKFSETKLKLSFTSISKYLGISSKDCVYCHLPFSYLYGLSSVLSALLSNARIIVENSSSDVNYIGNIIKIHKVSVLISIGDFLGKLSKIFNNEKTLDKVLTAADKLMLVQLKKGLTFSNCIIANYGQTEAGPRLLYSKFFQHQNIDLQQNDGVMALMQVVDNNIDIFLKPLEEEGEYELFYQSPYSADAYMTEKLEEIPLPKCIASQDVFYHNGKYFYFKYRKNNIVKFQGKFLPINTILSAIYSEVPEFVGFFVKRDDSIELHVEICRERQDIEKIIELILHSKFPHFKIKVILQDRIERTPSLKINMKGTTI